MQGKAGTKDKRVGVSPVGLRFAAYGEISAALEQIDIRYSGNSTITTFLKPMLIEDDVFTHHRVMPNVVTKKKMNLLGKLERIVKKYAGCGFNPTGSFDWTEREIEVTKVKVDLKLCADEFHDTIIEELWALGVDMHDLAKAAPIIRQLVERRIREGMRNDFYRMCWFNDTMLNDEDFNAFDGWWAMIGDLQAAGQLGYYTASPTGGTLSPGDARALFKDIVKNAPVTLRKLPLESQTPKVNTVDGVTLTGRTMRFNKMIKCTYELEQNYIDTLESFGQPESYYVLINGIKRPTYRGIPIIVEDSWEDILTNDLGVSDPHYAVYSSPMNLVVATDSVSNNQRGARLWYDEDTEENKFKWRGKLGADIVHPELISAAYGEIDRDQDQEVQVKNGAVTEIKIADGAKFQEVKIGGGFPLGVIDDPHVDLRSAAHGTLSGYTTDCADGDNSGNVKTIWVAPKGDVDTITIETDGTVSAIAMQATKVFFKYEVMEESGAYNGNGALSDTGSFRYEHELDAIFEKMSNDLRTAMVELIDCNLCGFVIVFEDFNEKKWLDGAGANISTPGTQTAYTVADLVGRLRMVEQNFTIEAPIDGANQGTIKWGRYKSKYPLREFTGTVPV